jgi:hypothetical protein
LQVRHPTWPGERKKEAGTTTLPPWGETNRQLHAAVAVFLGGVQYTERVAAV